jgi:hypothetical protein
VSASWVIVDRLTGKAVMETYNRSTAEAVNIEKYEVVPVRQYLASLNQKVGK